jgi:hypothetical protein
MGARVVPEMGSQVGPQVGAQMEPEMGALTTATVEAIPHPVSGWSKVMGVTLC